MKLKIYLDMDGVLADFDSEYMKVNGKPPSAARRDSKETDENWTRFVTNNSFEKLGYWPGAQLLLRVIDVLSKDPFVQVEILSSSGGAMFHDNVTAQKIKWLRDHGIKYKANIVNHRSKKKDYADEYSVLIDDTEDVIKGFTKNGGYGIMHYDVYETIDKLMAFYKKFKDNL